MSCLFALWCEKTVMFLVLMLAMCSGVERNHFMRENTGLKQWRRIHFELVYGKEKFLKEKKICEKENTFSVLRSDTLLFVVQAKSPGKVETAIGGYLKFIWRKGKYCTKVETVLEWAFCFGQWNRGSCSGLETFWLHLLLAWFKCIYISKASMSFEVWSIIFCNGHGIFSVFKNFKVSSANDISRFALRLQ